TLLGDEDLRALRTFEHLVPEPGLLLPGKRVAQSGTTATLHANAQTSVFDALLGHQRANLPGGNFTNLNHDNRPRPSRSQPLNTSVWIAALMASSASTEQ